MTRSWPSSRHFTFSDDESISAGRIAAWQRKNMISSSSRWPSRCTRHYLPERPHPRLPEICFSPIACPRRRPCWHFCPRDTGRDGIISRATRPEMHSRDALKLYHFTSSSYQCSADINGARTLQHENDVIDACFAEPSPVARPRRRAMYEGTAS